jgi:phage protein D
VSSVRGGAAYVAIEGLAATSALNRQRKSQTYVQQTVADIVRDLAAAVEIDVLEADIELSAYAVDGRHTVWWHILDLARLTGADVSASPEGALRFTAPRSGIADHTFQFGSTLLAWDIASAPQPEPATVVPHGAASEAGRQKWHWILNDPAGAGAKPAQLVGAFHSRAAAEALGKAHAARAARATVRGWFTVVGHAELRPGDLVELEGLAGPTSGLYRVTALRHSFDGYTGYTTRANVEGGGEGGGGIPGL